MNITGLIDSKNYLASRNELRAWAVGQPPHIAESCRTIGQNLLGLHHDPDDADLLAMTKQNIAGLVRALGKQPLQLVN